MKSSVYSEAMNETDWSMDIPLPWTLYAIWVIAAIGIPANLLTLLILLQSSMRTHSTFIYLAVIAVADTGVLVLWMVGYMNAYDVVRLGDKPSINIWMFNMFFQLLSCWLLVAVTTERYIAIVHPLRASVMCTTKRAFIVISVIAMLCGAVTTFEHLIAKTRDARISRAVDHVITALETGVPFLALFVLNSIIIHKIRNRFGTRESVPLRDLTKSEDMKTEDRQRRAERDKITGMLLVTTFAFLVLVVPFATIVFISRFVEVNSNFQDFCNILWYSNYAVNMFLYCLSGKRFREQMVNLVRSACRKCYVW